MSTPMEEANQLALEQQNLGKRIVQILTNSKKDPSSRKTDDYIDKRLKELETLWDEIQKNDAEIKKLNTPEHSYFKNLYFDQLEKKHDETKEYLEQCPTVKTKSVINLNPVNNDQETRLKKQKMKGEQLNRLIQKIYKEMDENNITSKDQWLINKAEKTWESMYELNEDIMAFETTFQDRYFIEDVFSNIEVEVDELMRKIEEHIANNGNTNQFEKGRPNIQLPKIKLPMFDGSYDQWFTFHDIFQKVIHESSCLTTTEKMQYLKTNVRGEASKIIKHLDITESNYQSAWEILKKRYQNKRLLVTKLVDKILDLPVSHNESSDELKQLHDVTMECINAMNNVGIETESWGPILTRIIMRKWDPNTNRVYEQTLSKPHEVPDFNDLMEFLVRRFQSLEPSKHLGMEKSKYSSSDQRLKHSKGNEICHCCNKSHTIYQCEEFKALPVMDRINLIKKKKLCYNCMAHESRVKCRSQLTCNICSRFHHTMLHQDNREKSKPKQQTTHQPTDAQNRASRQLPQSSNTINTSSYLANQGKEVLLPTAMVQVQTNTGTMVLLRALMDQGSQASFISEEAAQILALPREKIDAEISGIADGQPKISKWRIQAQINPRFSSNFTLNVQLMVMSKLTHAMPKATLQIDTKTWQNNLLADPTFNKTGPIDLLLGADEYGKSILEGLHKSEDGIIGQNTEFGWILSGNFATSYEDTIKITSLVVHTEDEKQLTRFWQIEEAVVPQHLNPDDQTCEEYYHKTTKREANGAYIVSIPFKTSPPTLGLSKKRAMARLLHLEQKLEKDANLKVQYHQFMEEYLKLGHMIQVSPMNQDETHYYIPHQPVIREASTTTKLRVVYDASSKTDNGYSLNDCMFSGPKLQQDISDVLLRWRKHRVVFSADIEKMYRQIKIHRDDQKFQKILWRFHPSENIKEYELTTVTHGTSAAPFLAMRTLQQLALDEKAKYPKASKIVLEDFYVDDLLSGTNSLEEARNVQGDLLKLMKNGSFVLRKWSSNYPELLQTLPESYRDQKIHLIEDETRKSLGVVWSPADDTFRLQMKINHPIKATTKRYILSEIAKLFDPLGWLGPVIIQAKLLIQELWLQQISWDEPVNQQIATSWENFKNQMNTVKDIKIPRWIYYEETKLELHGFCDASEKAYGAVIYSKTKIDGISYTTLLIAKSKVAPAKTKTTLPRLELCSAVLLAKLMERTIKTLKIESVDFYAWTDSMIALSWIKGDAQRWKTFVANRVSEIQSLVPKEHWSHVKTQDNPADALSRGIDIQKLRDHSLWWKGPKWLHTHDYFPNMVKVPDTEEEKRISNTCHQIRIQNQLERFREKLNQGLHSINEMNHWYKTTDVNKLNINILSAYQVATNFLNELNEYHSRLLHVQYNGGTLYDLISPGHVRKIIEDANKKMPGHLQISPFPTVKMEIEYTKQTMQVFSSFMIIDISQYDLIRVTPTPLPRANGSFCIFDVPRNILAVDYNNDLYFSLSEEEMYHCIALPKYRYICSPSVVKNIESNPNCVIDEIYERPGRTYCSVKQFAVTSIVWQQLHMSNKWLFLTAKPTRVAVICNGIRDDVLLNSTGVIKLSEDCMIKSKLNILQPKRTVTNSVLGTYAKSSMPVLNISGISSIRLTESIPKEPVLTITNNLSEITSEEKDLQDELHEKIWRQVREHSYLSHALSITTTLILTLLIWIGYKLISKRLCRHEAGTRKKEETERSEMIELQPLDPPGRNRSLIFPPESRQYVQS